MELAESEKRDKNADIAHRLNSLTVWSGHRDVQKGH